nr:LuxR C-terminal-related transcriptional regulator [Nocardioides agariphilus]
MAGCQETPSPEVGRVLHNRTVVRAGVSDGAAVSAREAEVLAAVAEHLNNAEIAGRLFISVRTVESHVSSLLRKLQVEHRRELIALAPAVLTSSTPPASASAASEAVSALPSPLTSFVGRDSEALALAQAVAGHRLVTVVGPGGIGKTRLALRVAHELRERFEDGVAFVDLVTVTESAAVPAAVASALRLGESQDRTAEQVIAGWLSNRTMLLVLDNCEHLLDAVGVLLEQVLTTCPSVRVLATSRSRLLLPFEQTYAVPGLSLEAAEGRLPDAVELFVSRAAGAGAVVAPADLDRVAALCQGLDGMALAIELAAARLPAVGLDGLEAGLADRLALLEGGRRVNDRHRSLRSALDWSHALLSEPERALLRRISVVAGPFSAQAAAEMLMDWAPVESDGVPALLARLADESLLVPTTTPLGTRYGVLETIRQYGAAQLEAADEVDLARSRHLQWCVAAAERLGEPVMDGDEGVWWRLAYDEVSVEARHTLPWACRRADERDASYRLSLLMARLSLTRGRPGESQRRYELAATLAPDDAASAAAYREAAGAADARQFGNEAIRLRELAADAALRAGDRTGACIDLARAAELVGRGPGIMAVPPPPSEVERLLGRARPLADGNLTAESRILTADAFARDVEDPQVRSHAQRALELARRAGDLLAESAALDLLTAAQLAAGELGEALQSAVRRTELLRTVPINADSALEFFDTYQMASQCALAAGDLPRARRVGEGLLTLPFYREEYHLATSRLIVVGLVAGTWDEAMQQATQFRTGWERAGRPLQGNVRTAPYAAAAICGLRGDDAGRTDWMSVVSALETPVRLGPVPGRLGRDPGAPFGRFFDALVLLHRGRIDETLDLLAEPPEGLSGDAGGLWRAWYASAWAEAAALADHPEAGEWVRRAELATLGNPIAQAVVQRASGLLKERADGPGGGHEVLTAAAATLHSLGASYQHARTLVMLGGEDAEDGRATLTAMGAAEMTWPPV